MGTMKTATARALLDPEVKKQAEDILKQLGLSVSKSFELFYRQVIAQRGLPFELSVPNEKTMKAIDDSRQGKGKRFSTRFKSCLMILESRSMRSIRRDTQFRRQEVTRTCSVSVKAKLRQYDNFVLYSPLTFFLNSLYG